MDDELFSTSKSWTKNRTHSPSLWGDDVCFDGQREYMWMHLYSAATWGYVTALRQLFESDADINVHNKDGRTPLHEATEENNVDVGALLEKGADINIQDKGGRTPLNSAASRNSVDVVRLLLGKNGLTPLYAAALRNNMDVVYHLLKEGAGINVQDKKGKAPLMFAPKAGELDLVRFLVEKGADINSQNKKGETAVHWAVRKNNVDLVRLLVDLGADINKQNKKGETAVHRAVRKNNVNLVRLLVDLGADINKQNQKGETAVHRAVRKNNADLVRLLVDLGADINKQNKEGKTPLVVALRTNNVDLVPLLVEMGADVNIPDKDGVTPLDLVLKNFDVELVRLLVRKGAIGNAQNQVLDCTTGISYSKYRAIALGVICVWVFAVCLLYGVSAVTVRVQQSVDVQLPVSTATLPCNFTTMSPANYSLSWRCKNLNGKLILNRQPNGEMYKAEEFKDTAFLGKGCSLEFHDPKPEYSANYSVTVSVPSERTYDQAQVRLQIHSPLPVSKGLDIKPVEGNDRENVTSKRPLDTADAGDSQPLWVIGVVAFLLLVMVAIVLLYCMGQRRRLQKKQSFQRVYENPDQVVPLSDRCRQAEPCSSGNVCNRTVGTPRIYMDV